MATRARYKTQLREALEKFDIHAAEKLVDDLVTAEEAGYVLTPAEHKLGVRLFACIDVYRRTAASLES